MGSACKKTYRKHFADCSHPAAVQPMGASLLSLLLVTGIGQVPVDLPTTILMWPNTPQQQWQRCHCCKASAPRAALLCPRPRHSTANREAFGMSATNRCAEKAALLFLQLHRLTSTDRRECSDTDFPGYCSTAWVLMEAVSPYASQISVLSQLLIQS